MTNFSVRDCSHRYAGGRQALTNVAFDVPSGLTLLLGPNGAGKSTLLKGLAGGIPLDEGGIYDDTASDPRRVRRVGYMPQNPRLITRFSAKDFVAYCAWLMGTKSSSADSDASHALARVGLDKRSGERIKTLSGGMRRRVALAAAIVTRPELLLLDEPLEGLDPAQRTDMRALLLELGRDVPIIISTHILQDVAEMAGWVVILDCGHVKFTGTLGTLLREKDDSSPAHLERQYLRFVEPAR